MKKVSVIIPTYKRPLTILRVLENIVLQDYPNFEVIVVDDNGLDTEYQKNTFKILLPFI